MALVDACIFTAASGGTSDFKVSAAVQGYMTPAQANAVDGDPYNYRAQSSDLTQWEIGGGVYVASTTTLKRVTVLFNSNGTGTLQSGPGSKIDFTDAPQVMLTALATDFGGGGANGWEQTSGSPGETTTTPINAPSGSGEGGPDIFISAGDGDGAGNAGNIVLEMASGAFSYDPSENPLSGCLLLDATNQGGNFYINPPYSTSAGPLAGVGQNLIIAGGGGDASSGGIELVGGYAAGSGFPGSVTISGGDSITLGNSGGSINAAGGYGIEGGNVSFSGGNGYVSSGGTIEFNAGSAFGTSGNGGAIEFNTGASTTLGDGGDLIFGLGVGSGGGRNGLFLPNLPTSDPGVSGAAWNDGGVVKISP